MSPPLVCVNAQKNMRRSRTLNLSYLTRMETNQPDRFFRKQVTRPAAAHRAVRQVDPTAPTVTVYARLFDAYADAQDIFEAD